VRGALAHRVGVAAVGGDFTPPQEQEIVVVRLQSIDVEPVAGGVVVGQRHEVESGRHRRVEDAVRWRTDGSAPPRRKPSITVAGVRVQVADEPPRIPLGDCRTFWQVRGVQAHGELDGVGASGADVRHAQHDRPTPGFDGARQIARCGAESRHPDARARPAAPAPQARRAAQAEVDDGARLAP